MAVDLYAGQWNPQKQGLGGAGAYAQWGGQGGGLGAPPPGNYGPPEGDANNIRNLAGGLAGQFQGNLGYADQALKTAFDPQQAQFKQQLADLTDQTRAGEAARGISMSPYGAGVEANTQGRFRNDWQTAQVGRQAQGAQTATGLQAQYQSGQTAAAGMYAQAAGISQADIGLQLQAYGLRGDQLAKAQQMMLEYMKFGMEREKFQKNVDLHEKGGRWIGGVMNISPY
jgi:hypothetical protein